MFMGEMKTYENDVLRHAIQFYQWPCQGRSGCIR
jgi:hypothetical protein